MIFRPSAADHRSICSYWREVAGGMYEGDTIAVKEFIDFQEYQTRIWWKCRLSEKYQSCAFTAPVSCIHTDLGE